MFNANGLYLTQHSGHIYSVTSGVLKVFALSGQILSSATINIVMHKKIYLILKFKFNTLFFYVFSKGLYWSPIAFIFYDILNNVIALKGVVCQEAHIFSGIMGGLLKELFKIIFNAWWHWKELLNPCEYLCLCDIWTSTQTEKKIDREICVNYLWFYWWIWVSSGFLIMGNVD